MQSGSLSWPSKQVCKACAKILELLDDRLWQIHSSSTFYTYSIEELVWEKKRRFPKQNTASSPLLLRFRLMVEPFLSAFSLKYFQAVLPDFKYLDWSWYNSILSRKCFNLFHSKPNSSISNASLRNTNWIGKTPLRLDTHKTATPLKMKWWVILDTFGQIDHSK